MDFKTTLGSRIELFFLRRNMTRLSHIYLTTVVSRSRNINFACQVSAVQADDISLANYFLNYVLRVADTASLVVNCLFWSNEAVFASSGGQ